MGDADVMAEPPHTFSQLAKHHLIINSSNLRACVQCMHNVPASHVVAIGQIWGTAGLGRSEILLAKIALASGRRNRRRTVITPRLCLS